MEEKKTDSGQLLQSLQQANKILRQRAIIIAILMIIAWGFLSSSMKEKDNSEKYFHYLLLLEKFKNSPDPKKFIEEDSLAPLYFVIDKDAIYYKVEKSQYSDKTSIVEAITEIKRLRHAHLWEDKTIGIFGLNVPVNPWLSIGCLIILILFHDFTETIFYRKTLQGKLKEVQIEDWQKGPELFGFHSFTRYDSTSKFLQFVSSMLIVIFLLCPVATCILIVEEVYGFIWHGGHIKDSGVILMIVSLICLITVLIETFLIFYHENIIKFKDAIDLLSGAKMSKNPGYKLDTNFFRIYVMFIITGFHYGIPFFYDEETIFMHIVYCLTVTLSFTLLYISFRMCDRYAQSKFWKIFRFWALLMNSFWIFLIIILMDDPYMTISRMPLNEIIIAFLYISILLLPIAWFLYVKFVKRELYE